MLTANVFAALGDPTRQEIVACLARADATISELAEPFDMSLQAVAKHIRVLEGAGIVKRKKIGRSHHCQLNTKTVSDARDWLSQVEKEWQHRLDRLAEYLESSEE